MLWHPLSTPSEARPPAPMTMRAQTILARHCFADHTHSWNQLVYATSGVLSVVADGRSFVISPDLGAWVPAGTVHHVGSFLGAEFRSLWVEGGAEGSLGAGQVTVFRVAPLLRALILEATDIDGQDDDDGYYGRIQRLIMDQLGRASAVSSILPWPRTAALSQLCECLYADPADPRGPEEWGKELGMSERTLARRSLADTGMTLRSWRRSLRQFRAIELLESGLDITSTAMELGYSSTSAFTYAFRMEMQCTPQAYMRAK